MIEDELYEFKRKQREHDTPSGARAPPKTKDETMEDAPSSPHELPAAKQELSQKPQKHLDKEPSVSTLTNDHPNQAMTDATIDPHTQHEESMEGESATAGKETNKRSDEQDNTRANEGADSNVEDNRNDKEKAVENAEREGNNTTTSAEMEAQAEADMIDEHHGETMVEAEEDTVIY